MIKASQKNAGVEQHFKKTISVEPHKVYKPSSRAYTIGAREIGLPKAQIGFVSSFLRRRASGRRGGHGRGARPEYVTFQLAEVAVPKDLFWKILSLIDDLRRRPVPA